MERKLVKHGPATYMISLPKKWVDKNNLHKGDTLNYKEDGTDITFSTTPRAPDPREVEADFSELSRSGIIFHLRAFYRQGYTTIRIRFKNPTTIYHTTGKQVRVSEIITQELRRFVGMELTDQRKSQITLQQLAEPSPTELDASMRRVFFLFKGTFEEMIDAFEINDGLTMNTMEERHDAITKLISFCIRTMHMGVDDPDKAYKIHTLKQIELITDLLRYFVKYMTEQEARLDKESARILHRMYELHKIYDTIYHAWDNKLHSDFNALREYIKQDVNRMKNPSTTQYFYYLLPILEIERDLIETRLMYKAAAVTNVTTKF